MSVWMFDIDWVGRPQTMNKAHTDHHHKTSKIRKAWKEATITACRLHRIPRGLDRIGLIVQPFYPNRSGLPDPDACAPTAKAVLAGLTVGRSKDVKDHGWGVVPDDNGKHVAYVCLMAPQVIPGCKPGVRVIITHKE